MSSLQGLHQIPKTEISHLVCQLRDIRGGTIAPNSLPLAITRNTQRDSISLQSPNAPALNFQTSAAEAAHRSPLWRDLATARHPSADLPAEEDSASDATGSAERSPRLALPVPVGLAEPPEAGTEEATEDEDMAAEPNYAFAKGYGRFGIGYTRLATALGNFEQGNIQAESTVVAQWLTSGLRVAMSRTGWNLLSPRYTLTKIPSTLLSNYYCNGYPLSPKMEDRPYNQYGQLLYSEGRWDQLCAWLTGNSKFRSQLAGHKQALRDHMGYSQEAADPSNKARRTAPPPGAGSSSSAAGSSWHSRPPPPPPPYGWWQ